MRDTQDAAIRFDTALPRKRRPRVPFDQQALQGGEQGGVRGRIHPFALSFSETFRRGLWEQGGVMLLRVDLLFREEPGIATWNYSRSFR